MPHVRLRRRQRSASIFTILRTEDTVSIVHCYRQRARRDRKRLPTRTASASSRSMNVRRNLGGLPPARFVDGDTDMFEGSRATNALWTDRNELRGRILHSVNIAAWFPPDPNPRTGRLAINTFCPGAAPNEEPSRYSSLVLARPVGKPRVMRIDVGGLETRPPRWYLAREGCCSIHDTHLPPGSCRHGDSPCDRPILSHAYA